MLADPLPLLVLTPERWAIEALRDPVSLLDDHAHLERKAATNAMELMSRWVDDSVADRWERLLAGIAREETDHLVRVLKLLHARGGRLSRHHHNPYARALRAEVRLGKGPLELVDRMLVSALVEVRSYERLELLARFCEDEPLLGCYRALSGSELGHYRAFLELAQQLGGQQALCRWDELLDAEAVIVQAQEPGPRMHSWPA